MLDIINKKYRHYKTHQLYEVIGIALHSETKEEMVVYRALYDCDQFGKNALWVRPKEIFFEEVTYQGAQVPRFELIMDDG